MERSGFPAYQTLTFPVARGHGFQEIVVGAQPGAGAGFQLGADSRYVSRLIAVSFRLVTSAAVANRGAAVVLQDQDGFAFAGGGCPVAQAASLTMDYLFGLYGGAAPTAGVGTHRFGNLPGAWLFAGHTVNILVDAIDTADQISRVRVTFERFFEAFPESPSPEQ